MADHKREENRHINRRARDDVVLGFAATMSLPFVVCSKLRHFCLALPPSFCVLRQITDGHAQRRSLCRLQHADCSLFSSATVFYDPPRVFVCLFGSGMFPTMVVSWEPLLRSISPSFWVIAGAVFISSLCSARADWKTGTEIFGLSVGLD